MNWINILEKHPEDGEKVIVWDNLQNTARILTFNEYYNCWDTEDGDDVEFDLDYRSQLIDDLVVRYWMPLPEKPE